MGRNHVAHKEQPGMPGTNSCLKMKKATIFRGLPFKDISLKEKDISIRMYRKFVSQGRSNNESAQNKQ